MALAFSRKQAYTLPSGHSGISATADNTNIYILSTDHSVAQIHTYNKQGVRASSVNTFYDADNTGLTQVGNGFAFLTESGNTDQIKVVSGAGAVLATHNLTSIPRVLTVYNLYYNSTTQKYIIFHSQSGSSFRRASQVSSTGTYEAQVTLPSAVSGFITGMAFAGDKWYVLSQLVGSAAVLTILDTGLSATSETQDISDVVAGETIYGLAWSQGQLIVLTNNSLYFYGTEPPAPPTPQPAPKSTRQLWLPSKYYRRYDIVKKDMDGSFDSAIATNIKMIAQTTRELSLVFPNTPIAQQFDSITYVPEFTVPAVITTDDLIQLNQTGNTEPTAIYEDAQIVKAIAFTGAVQKQVLIV